MILYKSIVYKNMKKKIKIPIDNYCCTIILLGIFLFTKPHNN